jgi:L-ribulose-5-phosphate 3-epimerase
MHEIGVMQGRLVPRIDGRIQAFPADRWRDEFDLARTYGFESIEFIFEAENFESNPLYTEAGRAEINALRARTGVAVPSICADYFMDRPFFRVPPALQDESTAVLKRLIGYAAGIGAMRIEIPCVDRASIDSKTHKETLVRQVSQCLSLAERYAMEIVFETSLPPEEFRELLERFRHPLIKANYDTGNSASLGYDPVQELTILGPRVSNIHIKDRLLHGSTVPLGTGNARFPEIFKTLAQIGYRGDFILQTARAADDIGAAIQYRDVVRSYLHQYFRDSKVATTWTSA